jgi:MFS family permease
MNASNPTDRIEPAPGAWLAVALLTLAYMLSYVDRTIIALLVGPIRADLGLSDTQFSLLHGLAFAIFYTVLGVPMARWADRRNRRSLIAAGVALWSLMTALGGLARNFGQLFAARVGVGVGEAALSPAAYSLITDLFPRHRLGLALALYGAAVYVGIGLTFLAGGWAVQQLVDAGPRAFPLVGTLQPWQQMLMIVGLPGLLVAVILLVALPEPRAGKVVPKENRDGNLTALRAFIGRNALFIAGHFVGFAMLTLMFNGYLAWIAEYCLRNHGWERDRTGAVVGMIILVAGTAGMLSSGIAIDAAVRRGVQGAALKIGLVGAVALLPWPIWATTSGSTTLLFAGLTPIVYFSSFCFGPAVVAIQTETPPALRAQVSALYLFVVNLTGIGFGSTAVALVSDRLLGGEDTLGTAMAIVGTAGSILGVVALAIAVRSRKDTTWSPLSSTA